MTAKTLEEEAREAAEAFSRVVWRGGSREFRNGRIDTREDFRAGYLAAATARDKEIEEVRARVKEVTEQCDAWPKYHGMALDGLMILHDRKDLQDLAGLRCGDFMANAVPHLVEEIDRLRARIAELEGREILWHELEGYVGASYLDHGEYRRVCEIQKLLAPPIPLPEVTK